LYWLESWIKSRIYPNFIRPKDYEIARGWPIRMSALNIYNLCSRTARDIDNWIMFKRFLVHYTQTPRRPINRTLSAGQRWRVHCLHTANMRHLRPKAESQIQQPTAKWPKSNSCRATRVDTMRQAATIK